MSISRGGEKFQAPLHKIESRDRPSGQIPNLIVKQDVSKDVSMQILLSSRNEDQQFEDQDFSVEDR